LILINVFFAVLLILWKTFGGGRFLEYLKIFFDIWKETASLRGISADV